MLTAAAEDLDVPETATWIGDHAVVASVFASVEQAFPV
jgi:hypothetical protein